MRWISPIGLSSRLALEPGEMTNPCCLMSGVSVRDAKCASPTRLMRAVGEMPVAASTKWRSNWSRSTATYTHAFSGANGSHRCHMGSVSGAIPGPEREQRQAA